MRKRINKTMMVVLALISAFSLTIATRTEALEPRLLWKKELKFKVTSVGFAKTSGDVIVSGKHDRQIIFFDKQGNTRFQWGPRIDRQPHGVGISDDGSYFIYESGWTENFRNKMKKERWDHRIHYIQKKGKELWSKTPPDYTWATLSPDGKYIAFAGVMGESGDIELWDSTGKRLWKKDAPASEDLEFSPDSKYIVADYGGGGIELIDLAGNSLFEKESGLVITSIAKDANYIATFQGGSKLLDKQGNIVLQAEPPGDLTLVSRDGTKGILWDKGGIKIYSLPSKALIKTYPIKLESRQTYFYPADISSNGRYLVLAGSKISVSSSNNIFVIDLVEDKVWETIVSSPAYLKINLTNDGKYLLIMNKGVSGMKSTLYYYQIF